ncbi:MAG: alkaline phosphatase family protein [Chitinophagaceae bacterium]|nr:alkaline phosphatase family protein [Chitinophagaceae bacterium]
MKRAAVHLFLVLIFFQSVGQTISRPKLIVGIVVDQMRWDFLYRYYDRFAATGGFKRILQSGFSCENTYIPYTPTVTACGHSCIYTGSVPGINGITGNMWWDRELNATVYCTEDKTVKTVGSSTELGLMSPRNLLVTTICDELRLATNFQSKVVGIAIKDRGGILTAGHSANAAYWYDNKTGDWITSTYYMNDLPEWVKNFNKKKLVDKYYEKDWKLLYPLNTYLQSTEDEKSYEGKSLGKAFPYNLKQFATKNYGIISVTPYGNTFTFDFAKEAVIAEQLGADNVTDILAVSLSSPDYIGHTFGPNSVEQEDDFLRLDKDLGDFLNFLDMKVGKGSYLLFLSSDHGVAHVPGFLREHKIPAGSFENLNVDDLNSQLKQKFAADNLVVSLLNYQVHLNYDAIYNHKLDVEAIKSWLIEYISKIPGIARVFETDKIMQTTLNSKVKEMLANGYYPKRSGDIQYILMPQTIEAFGTTGTTHGLWNPYDAHIPLLWYGWNIKPGKAYREVYMTDIAPTLAALLHIQVPSGGVGKIIEEIIK